MYFKEFLTEVRTGDLIAFNKAIETGQFNTDTFNDILQFFRDRGYREIGSGWYATVLQSTDHFIVKIAGGDTGYNQYVELARRERNPHFPRVIAQKQVEDVDVYFIERLHVFDHSKVEELVQHHTKKDAPMFVWLAFNFLSTTIPVAAKNMLEVANTLDPTLQLREIPEHPGHENKRKADQYWTNLTAYESELEAKVEEMISNHPFLRAVEQIKGIKESMDLHTGNIMIRKPSYQLVITDPLAG
jgi:hypothetical protein